MRSCLLLLLLAGCSDGLYSGGRRLQASFLASPDGAELFLGFWDAEISAPCTLRETAGGVFCVPDVAASLVFTEWTCTGPAVVVDPASPATVVATLEDQGCDAPPVLRVFELGEVVVTEEVWSQGCWKTWVGPDQVVRRVTEVGVDRLASATVSEEPVGGLVLREARVTDGAKAPLGLIDPAAGRACAPTDAAGGPVCAPSRQAYWTGGFGDPACSAPAALAIFECPPEIVADPSESCGGAPTFHEIEGELSSIYALEGACYLQGESTLAVLFDPQPAALPALSRAVEGGPFGVEVWRSGEETLLPTGRFVDPSRGPCAPEARGDGSYACVPVEAAPASYTSGVFLDPGCLVPLVHSVCDVTPTLAALRAERPSGGSVLVSVHELGVPVSPEKAIYAGGPGGFCGPYGLAGEGYWTLGDEVDVPSLEVR